MPTGFTARLMEDRQFDVKNWLLEDVPRGMGMCVALQEKPFDLSREQIEEALREDSDSSYHQKQIKDAEAKLTTHLEWSISKWKKACETSFERDVGNYKARCEDFNKEKTQFEETLVTLLELQRRTKDEVTSKTINFAIEQVKSTLDFDYKHIPTEPLEKDPEEFKINTLMGFMKSLEYHTEELKKSRVRFKDRLEAYRNYTKFIDENL